MVSSQLFLYFAVVCQYDFFLCVSQKEVYIFQTFIFVFKSHKVRFLCSTQRSDLGCVSQKHR